MLAEPTDQRSGFHYPGIESAAVEPGLELNNIISATEEVEPPGAAVGLTHEE